MLHKTALQGTLNAPGYGTASSSPLSTLVVQVSLILILVRDIVNYWRGYIGVSSSSSSGDFWEDIFIFFILDSYDFSPKSVGILIVEMILFLYMIRKFVELIVSSWGGQAWVTFARSRVRILRVFLSRSPRWRRAIFKLSFSVIATFMLWYICKAPGPQFLEFWLFPSTIAGAMVSGDIRDPNQAVYWIVAILTWAGVGHYLLFLTDIVGGNASEDAT